MLFQMMYDMNSGMFIIIAAFILGLIARSRVNSTFNHYSRVRNGMGLTGASMARSILDNYGLANIDIQQIQGRLTDHYDPRSGVLRLSSGVYDSDSVAAIGIAAQDRIAPLNTRAKATTSFPIFHPPPSQGFEFKGIFDKKPVSIPYYKFRRGLLSIDLSRSSISSVLSDPACPV